MKPHITMTSRRTLVVAILMAITLLCYAQPVSLESARLKAKAFMEQRGIPHKKAVNKAAAPLSASGITPYYVFNAGDNGGFVIIAGDERAETVMGYTREGDFDEAKMPEAMKGWLADCARQLVALGEGKLETQPYHLPAHNAVEKMVSSIWDQGEASSTGDAFNQLCPTIGGKHCVTGCVATAMAQIMRYNRWPDTFCKEIPAYTASEVGMLDKLPKVKFDWDNMLDKYDEGQSAASCYAVAQLMRYCGQAVEMDYSTGASSAYSSEVARAMKDYFGYDINTRYVKRSDFSIEGWDQLIYDELAQGRPVYYSGVNLGGGHAFVCDGYDGNGFYHINWGWSGHYNGFYKLDILNPKGGGTGGSSYNSGYSLEQAAIVGIQPPCGFDDDMRMLSLEDFYCDGHEIYGQYANRTGIAGTFEYGFAYHNVNTEQNEYHIANQTASFEPFDMRTVSANLDDWALPNGIYRFYPYTTLEGAGWYRVPGDFKKYFEVTVSNGSISNITYHPLSNMQIEQFVCDDNGIVNKPQEVKIRIKNKTEEYNGIFYLFASRNSSNKGEPVDKVGLPIEAGGVSETSLFFTPNAVGKWYVWIDIDEEGSNNLTPIEVNIKNPPTSKSNLELVSCNVDAKADVTFTVKVKNNGYEGYYETIYSYVFENGKEYNVHFDKNTNPKIAPGSTAEMTFRFEGLEMGKEYYMRLYNLTYHQSDEMENLGGRNYFTVGSDLDPNAIEQVVITTQLEEPTDVYTVTGALIRKGVTSLKGLQKGIYIVKGKKVVVR